MKGPIVVIARGFAVGLVAATPAFAGVGGSVVPSFPTPMNVGDAKTATITITNRSTAPNDVENINVLGIFFTPSCASSDGFTCAIPDPGTLSFGTIVGKTGTSCAGTVFTASPPDAETGELQLIPPVNKPVVLGPSNGSGPKPARCVILFNFRLLRLPVDSTPPGPPLTTDSLGHALLQSAARGNSGGASGGSTATITATNQPVDLSITVSNGATVLGSGASTK